MSDVLAIADDYVASLAQLDPTFVSIIEIPADRPTDRACSHDLRSRNFVGYVAFPERQRREPHQVQAPLVPRARRAVATVPRCTERFESERRSWNIQYVLSRFGRVSLR